MCLNYDRDFVIFKFPLCMVKSYQFIKKDVHNILLHYIMII